jgi:hypothetical protein
MRRFLLVALKKAVVLDKVHQINRIINFFQVRNVIISIMKKAQIEQFYPLGRVSEKKKFFVVEYLL